MSSSSSNSTKYEIFNVGSSYEGIWGDANMFVYTLPILELQIITIFFITELTFFLLKRFGITRFPSQIIGGLIISSGMIGNYNAWVFPQGSLNEITVLGKFSYLLFMFLMGVKMDLRTSLKVDRKGLYIAILSMLLSLLFSLGFAGFLAQYWELSQRDSLKLLYIPEIYSCTHFPVIVTLLNELKIINSELGRLALSASTASDLLYNIYMTISTLVKFAATCSIQVSLQALTFIVAYLIFLVLVFRPTMFWMIRRTPQGQPVKSSYVYIIMLLVLLSAIASKACELSFVYGPFLMGLATPDGPPLGSTLEDKLNCFVTSLFMPVFVTNSVRRANLLSIQSSTNLTKCAAMLLVLVILIKFFSCLVPSLCFKLPRNDALALSLILNCKGVIELATYTLFRQNMTREIFSIMTITILIVAIATPILVRQLYDPLRKYAGYQKRNIMHSDQTSELRILACIYREDKVTKIINFLKACNPNEKNPIALHVLHLIKLTGRSSPVFISHQLHQKPMSKGYISKDVILPFRKFERDYEGVVSLFAFTSISQLEYMHEDICTLALDNFTSVIILPFHRKWSIDGCDCLDDNSMKALNSSVLERAPCSVGILVDPQGLLALPPCMTSPSYCVLMMFFGGQDDREALTLAKRMAQNPQISLTVIRFVAINDEGGTNWERIQDSEVLKDVKTNTVVENGHVLYTEEWVKDGPETAAKIDAIVHAYDLIIVGRRHKVKTLQTAGLEGRYECLELGVIGDMLVSTKYKTRHSVLVVQQQQQMTSQL